jgi:hypothetical protein
VIPYLQSLIQAHPEVAAVVIFLLAVAAHVVVGALLHLVRLHDFDWHRLGAFVEQDFATARGLAILVTFLTTLVTTTVPGADWRAAFVPAFAALAASCAAATLPVLRDTLHELVELVTGHDSAPRAAPAPRSAA